MAEKYGGDRRSLSWAMAIWRGTNDIANSEQFVSFFQSVFNHSPDGKEVSDKLLMVRQGNHHAAEYALDFRTLAAESSWNDFALRAAYLHCLNRELLKEQACREEAASVFSSNWTT